MAIISPENAFFVDLTEPALRKAGAQPLEVGNDWSLRIRVRDEDDNYIDLTGASLILGIKKADGGADTFERKSTLTITGSGGTYQILIDADQVANRGYFTVNFTRHSEDTTALTPYIGRARPFQIRLKVASGSYKTVAKGIIDVLSPNVGSPP